jgi:glycosyltransferase involved in cell wall biosynthesis
MQACSPAADVAACPAVSVIIPTLRRPHLVLRALASVLAQTLQDFEIVVVVDGPDPDTQAALRTLADTRLRVIVNPRSLTAAGARNAGVAAARGEWLAFLDDDDIWLPDKLERQVALARTDPGALITCLSRIVRPGGCSVWPETIYDNARPFDEYLFDRRTGFAGAAFIQTSSLLTKRSLLLECPFPLRSAHDDWEFVLRATHDFGARVLTVPEVLVEIHEQAVSLSAQTSWKASLSWADGLRPLLTSRGYSGVCLGVAGPLAAREGAYRAFPLLIFKAFRGGSPRVAHLAAYLAFWLIPQKLRRQLRTAFASHRAA